MRYRMHGTLSDVCKVYLSPANKTLELEHLLQYCPGVVIVTETSLQHEIRYCELIPPTYNTIREDRNTRGGAVTIIFKKDIEMVELKSSCDTEIIWCETTLRGAFGAVCRPPNAPIEFPESMQNFQSNNVLRNTHLIIAGYFNLPDIQWNKLGRGNTSSKHCQVLLDIAFSNDLTQAATEGTRIGATG